MMRPLSGLSAGLLPSGSKTPASSISLSGPLLKKN